MSASVAKTAYVAHARKGNTSNPLLFHMYRARSRCVHAAIRRILKIYEAAFQQQAPQLLLLGAGLDVSFQSDLCYAAFQQRIFAVDLPEIIHHRETTLARPDVTIDAGTAADSSTRPATIPASAPAAACVNIAIDLAAPPSFSPHPLLAALSSRGFDFARPTVVLTEMVLGYLSEPAVRHLLTSVSSALQGPAFLVSYDVALDDRDAYSQTLKSQFLRRGAPLQCCHPSHALHYDMLQNCGWLGATCSISRAQRIYHPEIMLMDESEAVERSQTRQNRGKDVTGEGERAGREQSEEEDMMFDEFAALAMLHSRYALSVACSAACARDEAQRPQLLAIIPHAAHPLHIIPLSSGNATCSSDSGSSSSSSSSAMSTTYRLRPAYCRDAPRVSSLYTACMAPYASKYPSVAKFGRAAEKQLSNLGKFFGCVDPEAEVGVDGGSGIEPVGEAGEEERKKSRARFWVVCAVGEGAGVSKGESYAEGRLGSGLGGDVVACIGLRVSREQPNSPLVGEVQHMCCAPSHRRRGLASQLLGALALHAQSLDCARLELSVLTDLREARGVYTRGGFVGGKLVDCKGCQLEHMVREL